MLTPTDEGIISVGPAAAERGGSHLVYGLSPCMRALDRVIADIAPTDIPVLLIGESGTGKEVVALEIHRRSRRWNEPFLKCNCASPSSEWLRGVSNGSDNGHNGHDGQEGFANRGTLFLDEVSHLDVAGQLALLHSLPDGDRNASERQGGSRIISATIRNLEEELHGGRFREELYYRINGVCLRLTSLRHRKEDIPALLDFFLKKYASLFRRPEPQLSSGAMDMLLGHSWPGNVRELENVARKIVALADADLALSDLTAAQPRPVPESVSRPVIPAAVRPLRIRSLKEAAKEASRKAERELIMKALQRTHWNRKRTARDLQVSYKALLYKMKQLGLDGVSNAEASPGDES